MYNVCIYIICILFLFFHNKHSKIKRMQSIKMCCNNIDALNRTFLDIEFPKKRISTKYSHASFSAHHFAYESAVVMWLKLRTLDFG